MPGFYQPLLLRESGLFVCPEHRTGVAPVSNQQTKILGTGATPVLQKEYGKARRIHEGAQSVKGFFHKAFFTAARICGGPGLRIAERVSVSRRRAAALEEASDPDAASPNRSTDFSAFASGFGAVASKRSGNGQVCCVASRLAGQTRRGLDVSNALPIWKSAIQRVWKPAPRATVFDCKVRGRVIPSSRSHPSSRASCEHSLRDFWLRPE